MTTITIPQLPTIPNANISASSILPIVDTTGVPQTDKVTVGNLANFVLTQAGNLLENAFLSTYAESVTNAAQPNITSVGTLSVSTLKISGGTNGQYLRTDGTGNLSWASGGGGGSTGNISFEDNIMYNLDGLYIDNSDLSHNATAAFIIPNNGSGNVEVNNTYGNVLIQTGPSNSLDFTWNFDDTGNLNAPGDIVGPENANFTIYSNAGAHSFTFGGDGTFYAPDNVVLGGTSIAIGPGAEELVGSLTNAVLVASSDLEAYIQAVINNVSDVGSADWVALGHLGNNDYGWSDMGFNSSGFNDANYTITGQGDGYFIVQTYANGQAPGGNGGNLIIATGDQGTTNDIIFATGGFLTENEFARIENSNNLIHLTRDGSAIKFFDGSVQNTAFTGSAGYNISNASSNVTIPTANGSVYINKSLGGPLFDNVNYGSAPSGYLSGTYTDQPTSGGTGTGMTVDYTCATTNQPLTSLNINNPGTGYSNGDTITVDGGNASFTIRLTATYTFNESSLQLPTGGVVGFDYGYIGQDSTNDPLQISSGTKVQIQSNENGYTWEFDATGNLITPGNIIIGDTATGQTISTYRQNLSILSTDPHDAGFVGTTIVGWTNNLDFTQERATIVFNDSLGNVDIVTGNGESTLYDWRFDNTGTMTLPGYVNLPLVSKLTSGGIEVTNSAEFGTNVTVNGSNVITGSQIYMGAGTAESRAIVNSSGNSLMYSGVENPGFAGMVSLDPGVTSEYAIQVGANNEIQIGAVVGPITTPDYVAGLGVLNGTGNINGIFANANVTVIGAGDLGWMFGSDGNLTIPGNIIVDTMGTANISSDDTIGIVAGGNVWAFGTLGVLANPVLSFSSLPSASTPGLKAFINDANLTAVNNFGVEISGGGGNTVPVFSNGSTWCIG